MPDLVRSILPQPSGEPCTDACFPSTRTSGAKPWMDVYQSPPARALHVRFFMGWAFRGRKHRLPPDVRATPKC